MQGTMSWNHSARERADGEKRRTSRQSSCVKLPDVGVSPMYNTSSQKRAVSIQQPTLQLHGVKPHHLAADSKQQQLSINYLKRRAVAPNYTQWQRTKAPKYDSEEQPTTPAQQLFKIKGIVRNSKAQPLSKGIRSSKDTSSVTFAPPHTSGNLQRPKASTLPDCQKTDDVIRVGKQQAPFSRRIVRTDSVKTRKKPRKPPESPAVRLLKVSVGVLRILCKGGSVCTAWCCTLVVTSMLLKGAVFIHVCLLVFFTMVSGATYENDAACIQLTGVGNCQNISFC